MKNKSGYLVQYPIWNSDQNQECSVLYLSFCVIKQFAKLRTTFCTVRANAFTFKFLWQSYLTLTHLSFFCTSHVYLLGPISWRPVDPSYFALELNNSSHLQSNRYFVFQQTKVFLFQSWKQSMNFRKNVLMLLGS